MAIGNSWSYNTTNYTPDGQMTSTGSVTLTIPRDTAVSGETWYHYAAHGTIFWTTRTDGVWRWENPQDTSNKPVLYLKYPTYVGDTITVKEWSDNRTVMTTLSLDTVTSGANGLYRCLLYRQSIHTNDTLRTEEYLYYSIGTGWVASETYNVIYSGTDKLLQIHTSKKLNWHTIL